MPTLKKYLSVIVITGLLYTSTIPSVHAQSQALTNILTQINAIQSLLNAMLPTATPTETTAAISTTGLLAYYDLDDGSGATADDRVGGADGQLLNGPTWDGNGVTNGALRFDGSNDAVDIGVMNITGNAMTISMWFNADDFGVPDGRLISKATSRAEQDHYYMISTDRVGNGDRLRFRLKTSGLTSTLIGNTNISAGTWNHVVATYDGISMRLYQNGVEVGSQSKSGPISTSGSADTWMGNNPGPDAKPFDGLIDEVRLYNRALTAAEVSELYSDPGQDGSGAAPATAPAPTPEPDPTPEPAPTPEPESPAGPSPTVAGAAVTGLSGSKQITITGSSFGSQGPDVAIYDSFENEQLTEDQWNSGNLNPGSVARTGVQSHFAIDSDGPTSIFRKDFGTDFDEIYMSYWVKLGTDYFPGAGAGSGPAVPREFADNSSWKFAWLMDGDRGYQGNNDFDMCLPTHTGRGSMQLAGNDGGFYRPGNSWFSFDEWNRIAVKIKKQPGDFGFFQTLSLDNGMEIQSFGSDSPFLEGVTDVFNYLTMPGWARGGATAPVEVYYDDVYIAVGDGSSARVEIANSPNYETATIIDNAKPESWSNDRLTVTLPTSSGLESDGNGYLFVFNNEGKRNSVGFPLSGTPQTEPEPAPTPEPQPDPEPVPTSPQSSSSAVDAPYLAFSDLISGPDTGLDDGLGDGTIVTLWGANFGSSQSDSTVEFCDAQNDCREAAHIYYWKNADGQLPGGPADLYESHGFQEIAFSIPDSAPGEGQIFVRVDGEVSNSLPFTVRPGAIYHVRAAGSDLNGDGSYANPWRTMDKAETDIEEPGATVYVHDSITEGEGPSDRRAFYWNNTDATSGIDNQYSYLAFPNSQPLLTGSGGFSNYRTAGMVVAKFKVRASNHDEISNGQRTNYTGHSTWGIQTSAYGRAVANNISDIPGMCASAQGGAIVGNARDGDRVSAYQVLGNEIFDYGCEGSNKLHHTTYLSIRSDPNNTQVDPWRFGWNYLHGNKVKNGIHQYDETGDCGDITGPVNIHDNVVIDQAGAGIFVGSTCGWSNDWNIYNNIVINAGLLSDWDGINPGTVNGANTSAISVQDDDLLGTIDIYNNLFYKWNGDDLARSSQACLGLEGESDNLDLRFRNNICWTDSDKHFVNHGFQAEDLLDNPTGSSNIWYYAGAGIPSQAIVPTWDTNPITANPYLTVTGTLITMGTNSSAFNAATGKTPLRDVYAKLRTGAADIGPIEGGVGAGTPTPTPTPVSQPTPPADTLPPQVTGGQPTTEQPTGTDRIEISVQTNETATCRYAFNPEAPYNSMTNIMSASGNTHTGALEGLVDGGDYNVYIKCRDTVGNTSSDATISFSVAMPESPTPEPSSDQSPYPVSLTGEMTDGALATVTGVGFGTKSQSAPLLFDTQDKVWINGDFSRPYQGLSHGDSFPTGGSNPWLTSGTGNLELWTNDGPARYGAVYDSNNSRDAWVDRPNGVPDPTGSDALDELYVRWWFKQSGPVRTPTPGSQSNKFIRIWDTNGGSDVGVRISWTQMHMTYDNGSASRSSWSSTNPTPGAWNLLEAYVRTDPNPQIQMFINGNMVHDVDDFRPDTGYQGLHPRLWGMDGSGVASFIGDSIELSDYYLDQTRARVEIGDAPTWTQNTTREPQIITSWSDTTIQFEVYEGFHDSLSGKYLYVIDEYGNVNQNGYPLSGESIPQPVSNRVPTPTPVPTPDPVDRDNDPAGTSPDDDNRNEDTPTANPRSSGGGGGGGSNRNRDREDSFTPPLSNVNPSAGTDRTGAPLRVASQTTTSFPYRFTDTDRAARGSEGENVRQLQRALNRLGYTIAPSGDGAPGLETTFFGPATERALQRFQADNGIVSFGDPESTGFGAFGPSTREKLNERLANSAPTTPRTVTPEVQARIDELLRLIAVLQALLLERIANGE